jgi:flagellar motility protein MotE (MotC chaperone)
MIRTTEHRVGGFPVWFKWVAGIKLSLLVVFLAVQSGAVRFGEIGLQAAEAGSTGSIDPAAGNAVKPSADGTRKSFLDDLLELPALNREKLQKEDVARYLSMADRKKKQIDERVTMLGRRERQLQGLEKSIDDKLKRLDDERKFFAQSIQQEKDLKGQRLDKLVELYDKMEPKKAAPVIEKMDEDLVVALFKRLRQKQVTLVLETMSAEKSVKLSEYFGRVRSGKEYDLLKEMNSSLRQEFADCKGLPKEDLPENSGAKPAELGTSDSATKPVTASLPAASASPAAVVAPAASPSP